MSDEAPADPPKPITATAHVTIMLKVVLKNAGSPNQTLQQFHDEAAAAARTLIQSKIMTHVNDGDGIFLQQEATITAVVYESPTATTKRRY